MTTDRKKNTLEEARAVRDGITVEEYRERQDSLGFGCPSCGCRDFRVRRTSPAEGAIKRIRICRHCGYKMVTNEVPQ